MGQNISQSFLVWVSKEDSFDICWQYCIIQIKIVDFEPMIPLGFYDKKRICNKEYISYPAYIVDIRNDDNSMWGHHLDDGNLKEFYEKDDFHTSIRELLYRPYEVSKIPHFFL